jgi:signal transduction histidine kinase
MALLDRHRVLQLLGNLLGNALKFTPRGGQIRLSARRHEGALQLSVRDNGPGIPPEDMPHLFDRFWQGAHDRRAGVGLGLAIAKGIADSHGGALRVESTPGEGARFVITLPLGTPAEQAEHLS